MVVVVILRVANAVIYQTRLPLLVDVLAENGQKMRFLLHDFVIMPNHFHLLLTPAADISLEKALQLIKGGFSYRAKREVHFACAMRSDWRSARRPAVVEDTKNVRVAWAACAMLTRAKSPVVGR